MTHFVQPLPDVGHRVGNLHFTQHVAPSKCIHPDFSRALRDFHEHHLGGLFNSPSPNSKNPHPPHDELSRYCIMVLYWENLGMHCSGVGSSFI